MTRCVLGLAAFGSLAVGLAACGASGAPQDANLVAGKRAFVQKCGSCHRLERAGTSGTVGPDLDAAFRQSLSDGFGRAAVRGAVRQQIGFPAAVPQASPAYMPPKLVTGKTAFDVAAYVASVVSRPGEDEGLLATAVKKAGAGKPAVAQNGVLKIPADPGGQLSYTTKVASAGAGKLLTVQSLNASSVPHDIAIEGNGVREKVGKVVSNGGVSKIQVKLKPGQYTFFCTVQGHREAGMVGKLTVK